MCAVSEYRSIDYCAECDNEEEGSANRLSLGGRLAVLIELFGSKCLPDETKDETKNDTKEPTPAEPKYHVGDWVRVVSIDKHGHIGQITEVEYEYGCNYYRVSGAEGWHFLEKNLEPYTDPNTSHETPVCENHSDNTSQKEVNVNSNRNLSQETANCDKEFDAIIKNNLSKERRLNIAAMAMQGILSNSLLMEMFPVTNQVQVVHCALAYADALISECESSAQPLRHAKKGGQE